MAMDRAPPPAAAPGGNGDRGDRPPPPAAVASASALGEPVLRNQPYAGGHIVRTHGRPGDGVHAIQIEIDRSLYLTAEGLPDAGRIGWLSRWFAEFIRKAGQWRPDAQFLPQAAE